MKRRNRTSVFTPVRAGLVALVVALAVVLSGVLTPSAALAEELGSLSVSFADPQSHEPLQGVGVDVYRVASVDGTEFAPQGPFAELPITWPEATTAPSGQWTATASTLASYVQADEQRFVPDSSATSGADGVAAAGDSLQRGIYLVITHSKTVGETSYTFSPILVAVPQDNQGVESWRLSLDAKAEARRQPEGGSLRVLKRWNDAGGVGRPKSVTVQIWRDRKLFSTQELSDSNDWSYTWEEGEAGHEWAVTEVLPSGSAYKVSVQRGSDGVFTLINSRPNTPPSTPSKPSNPQSSSGLLPKTGEPWLPLTALLCAGIAALAVGQVAQRRGDGDGRA